MEQALSDVCKDIRIGKILIQVPTLWALFTKLLLQTNWESGEPELYYLRLPKDIKDYQVMADSQVHWWSVVQCREGPVVKGNCSQGV